MGEATRSRNPARSTKNEASHGAHDQRAYHWNERGTSGRAAAIHLHPRTTLCRYVRGTSSRTRRGARPVVHGTQALPLPRRIQGVPLGSTLALTNAVDLVIGT